MATTLADYRGWRPAPLTKASVLCWTRCGFDTRDGDPGSVSAKLLQGLNRGDILLLHDGNAARTSGGDAVILEVLPRLLDAIAAANLRPAILRSVIA